MRLPAVPVSVTRFVKITPLLTAPDVRPDSLEVLAPLGRARGVEDQRLRGHAGQGTDDRTAAVQVI